MHQLGKGLLIVAMTCLLAACQSRMPNEQIVTFVATNQIEGVLQYLEERGDPNATNNNGDPLLFIATGAKGGMEVAELLIKAGADIDGQSGNGRTILVNAAGWCDFKMVRMILDAGADANKAGNNGETPLQAVCKSPVDRRGVVIEMLKSAGAVED